MIALLTLNGIPPRIIGSLTEEQRKAVASYASSDRRENLPDDWWENGVAEPIRPFAKFVSGAASSFMSWGATILNNNKSVSFRRRSELVNQLLAASIQNCTRISGVRQSGLEKSELFVCDCSAFPAQQQLLSI